MITFNAGTDTYTDSNGNDISTLVRFGTDHEGMHRDALSKCLDCKRPFSTVGNHSTYQYMNGKYRDTSRVRESGVYTVAFERFGKQYAFKVGSVRDASGFVIRTALQVAHDAAIKVSRRIHGDVEVWRGLTRVHVVSTVRAKGTVPSPHISKDEHTFNRPMGDILNGVKFLWFPTQDGTYKALYQGKAVSNVVPAKMETGYWVSSVGVQYLSGEFNEWHVKRFLSLFRSHVMESGFFGIWQDNGVTYLDVSYWFKSKRDALKFGKLHNQLTVWDIANCQALDVRTGKVHR